ncbi:Hypothetical protein A7982_01164 [Minicystis rosea]|nr:Hypothetical protein A7982_01164 [Minicystis rosea]
MKRLWLIAGMLAAALALPRVAAAQNACTTTSTFQSQSYRWKVGVDATSDVQLYPDIGGLGYRRYDNQQKHTRYVLANARVSYLGLSFASFETETNYDQLTAQTNHPAAGSFSLTGLVSGPFSRYIASDGSFQHDPARLEFSSDYSVTKKGFDISAAQVLCNGAVDARVFQLPLFRRAEVLLLGAGDFVEMTLPGSTDTTLRYSVALWNEQFNGSNGPGGEDIDVYVACGATPTASTSLRSTKIGNQEYVEWRVADVPCASEYHVKVVAYGGGSSYAHVLAAKHKDVEHKTFRVGLRNAGDATKRANTLTLLRRTAAAMYGGSSGQAHYDFDLYETTLTTGCKTWSCGGSACEICIDGDYCGGGSDGTDIGFGYCAGEIASGESHWRLAHELGHLRYHLSDFYDGWTTANQIYWSIDATHDTADPSFTYALYNGCGHSMMANSYLQKHFCTGFDHFYNQRFVKDGAETQVLASFSGSQEQWNESGYDAVNRYRNPLAGTTYDFVSTAPQHSTYYHEKNWGTGASSDYGNAVAQGKWSYEPAGSPDPYGFDSFGDRTDLASFPSARCVSCP